MKITKRLTNKTYVTLSLILLSFSLGACSEVKESTEETVKDVPDEITTLDATSLKENMKPVLHSQALWPKSKTVIPSDEARIQSILAKMSVEHKVGQMVMGEIRDMTPEDVRKYKLGGVLNGGGAFPFNKKRASAAEWVDLADQFYQASIDHEDDAPKVPILWGTDAVHGNSNVFGATMFPHNIGLGATRNPELIRQLGEVTAKEVLATGLYWTFAPTVAVPRDDRWGRTYEGFSEDPALVAELASSMMEGLQGAPGDEFLGSQRILATAKHFIGDGGTQNGVDQGNAVVNEKELSEVHGLGYFAAMDMGVQSVMSSFNSWNGKKIHGDHYLLTEVLKNKMGFDGFVIGDWNGHGQVPGCTNESCAQSINAGVDMIMVPQNWEAFYKNTLQQVLDGEIPMARVDDAVTRILRVKQRMGMFDDEGPKSLTGAGDQSLIGHPDHREIARQAVRESLVLLKNQEQVLPLQARSNVLVAGSAANEIYNQTGGWSMTWLGTETVLEDFPGATRIVDAIQQDVVSAGGSFAYSETGDYSTKPDVAIMIISEPPYAEGPGDRPSVVFSPEDRSHLEVMQKLKAADIPVVTLFLSGRPMWVNPELNSSDAFVAAWLPGTEGQGVSDVLFCTQDNIDECGFKGQLSFSWPKSALQEVLNHSDSDYDPLFKFGFGLKYGESGDLDKLPEESGIENASVLGKTIFRGRGLPPFSVLLQESGQAKVPASQTSSKTPSGGVQTQIFDWKVQEDAQRVSFNGNGLNNWILQTGKMLTWHNETQQGAFLSMDIRVLKRAEKPLLATMECPASCRGSLDLSADLKQAAFGDWQAYAIPLQCFDKAGADLNRIQTPLILQSEGDWSFELTNIRIVESADQILQYKCN